MFFAGLVLWAIAANATPLASAANKQLRAQSNQLADQFCTTKCHWSYFWEREVCETDCTDYKLQQHDQQLAQTCYRLPGGRITCSQRQQTNPSNGQ
jgi:hypothetical protein